jgi:hypothetical protein
VTSSLLVCVEHRDQLRGPRHSSLRGPRQLVVLRRHLHEKYLGASR